MIPAWENGTPDPDTSRTKPLFVRPQDIAGDGGILDPSNHVQIFVSTPKNPDTGSRAFTTRIDELLNNYLTGDSKPFQGVNVHYFDYDRLSKEEQEKWGDSYRGRMVISFDPEGIQDQHRGPAYRVWQEKEWSEATWCAGGNQKREDGEACPIANSTLTQTQTPTPTPKPSSTAPVGTSEVPSPSSTQEPEQPMTPTPEPPKGPPKSLQIFYRRHTESGQIPPLVWDSWTFYEGEQGKSVDPCGSWLLDDPEIGPPGSSFDPPWPRGEWKLRFSGYTEDCTFQGNGQKGESGDVGWLHCPERPAIMCIEDPQKAGGEGSWKDCTPEDSFIPVAYCDWS